MFIVWGTKQTERKLGLVADYCPVCDEPQVFRLLEARFVSHVYYISLGRGRVNGHVRQCKRCKNKIATDILKYQSVSRNKRASLEQLTDETHPGLVERMAEFLDLREQAARGEATEQDRRNLLRQPFQFIVYPVAQRKANIQVDGFTALWFLAMIVLPLPVLMMMDLLPRPFSTDPWVVGAIVGLLLVLGVCLIISIAFDGRRFARRRFGRMIVQRLAPLDPSPEELQEVLTELKASPETRTIGKAFRAEKIHAKITAARDNAAAETQ